jgi:hypothetical protein
VVLDSEAAVPVGDVTGEDRVAVVRVAGDHEAEFAAGGLPALTRPLCPAAAILVPAGERLTGRLVTTPPPGRHAVVTYHLGVLS